jgi:hypothetical protein
MATLTEMASGSDWGAARAWPAKPTDAIRARLVRRVLADIRGLLVELRRGETRVEQALRRRPIATVRQDADPIFRR